MRAITLADSCYTLKEVKQPMPTAGEVLIKVAYAGVNRADLFQAQGKYPLPASGIPGLEVSGEIVACGAQVAAFKAGAFKAGDSVCALLSEGGFAQYVCAPVEQVLSVPEGMILQEAAALPEACFTAWISLVWQAKLQTGESVLIHGGASGIGTIAIQIARFLGARVFATAGTEEKCAVCTALGAHAIDYKKEDFVAVIKEATNNKGVDVIMDMVGGDYLPRNLAALAHNGRLCIIAFLKGAQATGSVSAILLKHLTVMGSTLRARCVQEKAAIAAQLQQKLWPSLSTQRTIKPMIAKIFPLEEAEKALDTMDKGLNIGKILLKI